ncbi:4-hydroxythreonine-4-phosphate dehydrogenase 2 [Raoultella planticola]|uniref:4-hydroxythreonine-4-phosphate dehydrogenase 2 n=1 Tax=Raoultella planticola TaxID=575 RepID=A0A485CCV1_RAOPL|nr:4-hydroxythreonine-4-phosphate dehydrogenase 2 [Raoultella planticola]
MATPKIFAHLTDTRDPLTLFQVRTLRVFFLTRHLSLVEAIRSLTPEKVCDYAVRCTRALQQLGVPQPKLVVAAINPHGGEHGLFGHEDDEVLLPGIELAREQGIAIEGPKPADSVFHFALLGHGMPYCRRTMTRGISPPKWWTSTAPFLSPAACLSYEPPLITVRQMILRVRGLPIRLA